MPPSVVLEVEYAPNVVVDFSQLAEKKYGFEAMHPTIANADDLLVDDDGDDNEEGDNDEEEDRDELPQSQQQTGPQPSTGSATPSSAQPSKKRGRKVGKYDLHDPFIDDAEMEWESTAAATKDGFFVYSGVFENEDTETSSEKDGKKTSKRKKETDSSAGSKRRKQAKKKTKADAVAPVLREIRPKEVPDTKKSSEDDTKASPIVPSEKSTKAASKEPSKDTPVDTAKESTVEPTTTSQTTSQKEPEKEISSDPSAPSEPAKAQAKELEGNESNEIQSEQQNAITKNVHS